MSMWSDFVQALGQGEDGPIVKELCLIVVEPPEISETPNSYNDPLGKTRYCKFFKSGMEFGFRSGKLNHIHLFVQGHEGYSAYKADILDRKAQAWNAQDIICELGPADNSAPGRLDMLIGYVQQWFKYDFETYALRLEFSEGGELWKATLISN